MSEFAKFGETWLPKRCRSSRLGGSETRVEKGVDDIVLERGEKLDSPEPRHMELMLFHSSFSRHPPHSEL
jgi:hypothetical protein